MEVAEQIVVMNDGKVEQSGGPRDLYEHPASEFVMSLVGPAHRIGDAWVRPQDVEIRHEPNGKTIEALIDRVVHIGFEVRGGALEPGTAAAWLYEHVGDGSRSGVAVVGTHAAYDSDATAVAICSRLVPNFRPNEPPISLAITCTIARSRPRAVAMALRTACTPCVDAWIVIFPLAVS